MTTGTTGTRVTPKQHKEGYGDRKAAAAERLNAFNEEQTDWYVTCPRCGKRVTGTLEALRKHQCVEEESYVL